MGETIEPGLLRMNRTCSPPRGSGSVTISYVVAFHPAGPLGVNHPTSSLVSDSGHTVPVGSVHVAVIVPTSSITSVTPGLLSSGSPGWCPDLHLLDVARTGDRPRRSRQGGPARGGRVVRGVTPVRVSAGSADAGQDRFLVLDPPELGRGQRGVPERELVGVAGGPGGRPGRVR